MRLIDADALKKKISDVYENKNIHQMIDEIPSVDAVPVVRCKDCKYYPDGNGTTKWLPCREMITRANWFCADGEKVSE